MARGHAVSARLAVTIPYSDVLKRLLALIVNQGDSVPKLVILALALLVVRGDTHLTRAHQERQIPLLVSCVPSVQHRVPRVSPDVTHA